MTEASKTKHADHGDSDLSSNEGGDQVIDLNNIKLENGKDFPIDLDVAAEFQNILAAGILHNPDNVQLYDQICEIIFGSDRTFKLTKTLFWIVFCIKYQPKSQDVLQELRTRVSKLYSKHFASLPAPKDKIANYLIFLMAYCAQITFYNVFPNNRNKLTMRFILDIYHVVIFELHGLYVSDSYIQSSIEKIIGTKFFFYEQQHTKKKKKSDAKDKNGGPLLRDLNFNPDSLLNVPGGVEFASELSYKLRDKKFWLTSHDTSQLPGLEKPKPRRPTKKQTGKLQEESAKANDAEDSESKKNLYFPQIRFDCTQISPTVSRFLNNPTMSLPFQEKKLMKYTNNKHLMQVKHYDVPTSIDHLIAKKANDKEKIQTKQTQFQHYSLKARPDDYALEYLPTNDKFKLRERFKEEIDLKYILDHVGNYSLKPTTYRNFEDNKKLSYSYSRSYRSPRDGLTDNMSYLGQSKTIDTQPDVSARKDTELSPDRFETEPHHSKRDSLKESPPVHLLSETDKNSLTEPRKPHNLTVDMNSVFSPRTVDTEEHITQSTPLETPQNPTIYKKLGKAGRKLNMINAMRPDPDRHNENREEKSTIARPLPKISLAIQDYSRKGKVAELLDADDAHAEKRRNERGFVYESKRQHYIEEHGQMFSKDVDRNINELVGTIATKKNKFSRNITKYARQIRK